MEAFEHVRLQGEGGGLEGPQAEKIVNKNPDCR